jgi:hypothetical protein
MATSPVPLWAQEMSPHHRGPTGVSVLALAVVAVLLGLALSATASTQGGEQGGSRWQSPACAEQARLERHGATSGRSYRVAVRACMEASSDGP